MKLFTHIFALYILVLGCLPCSDLEDCKYKASNHPALATTDHNDHEQDTEHCSPFCICSCCGQSYGFNFPQSLIELPVTVPPIQTTGNYQSPFISEVYASIWQPPKIS